MRTTAQHLQAKDLHFPKAWTPFRVRSKILVFIVFLENYLHCSGFWAVTTQIGIWVSFNHIANYLVYGSMLTAEVRQIFSDVF